VTLRQVRLKKVNEWDQILSQLDLIRGAPSEERKMQNAECGTKNAKCKMQNAERRTQNAKRGTLHPAPLTKDPIKVYQTK